MEPLVLVCPGCGEATSEWRSMKGILPTMNVLMACPNCQSGFPMSQWRKADEAPPAHVTPVLVGQGA